MPNNIVTLNVSQTIAPSPNNLQEVGVLISQGGTNTTQNTLSLLTQLSDLTPILAPAKSLVSLIYAAGTVTATFSVPHGWTTAETVTVVVAGALPVAFNGTFQGTVTTASVVTFPLGSAPTPTTATVPGTMTLGSVGELTAMATTFFAQGSTASIYVLELGEGNVVDGVTALTTYLTANPKTIYSVLVPRNWDAAASFLTLIASYEATTSMLYFYVTTTTTNYTSYTALMKNVFALIEAPGIPALEFSVAAALWININRAPSPVNQVTPMAFSFVVGVTPYPTKQNSALRTTLKTAGINIIGTGAEGGISNTILLWGTTMDLRDFTYWYAVDWVQLNLDLDLSNEVINGSNNPINPLYFNQPGINRLQARGQGTMTRGVTYGMVLGPVTVNAIPFGAYTLANPSDYKIGKYGGLSVTFTPSRGFTAITFNVNVTDFPSA
jgi:hypothetical protein